MTKRRRRSYTDKFRATAVVMLEAQGYPDEEGALTKVAKHLDTPLSTLRGWYLEKNNPPPTEIRNEKKGDLAALLDTEVREALTTMGGKRVEANYKDLATAVGIMVDKMRLLQGQSTDNQAVNISLRNVDTDILRKLANRE